MKRLWVLPALFVCLCGYARRQALFLSAMAFLLAVALCAAALAAYRAGMVVT